MPSIYVAVLADYTNGYHHGKWIDATTSVEEINEEIDKLLRTSKYPNVARQDFHCPSCHKEWHRDLPITHVDHDCPHCLHYGNAINEPYPSAEEFAIHDYTDFFDLDLGEYPSIKAVFEAASGIATNGEIYAHLRSDGFDHDKALDEIDDNFRGIYDKLSDYVYELAEDSGDLKNIPDYIKDHIDWDDVARDMEINNLRTYKMETRDVAVFINR